MRSPMGEQQPASHSPEPAGEQKAAEQKAAEPAAEQKAAEQKAAEPAGEQKAAEPAEEAVKVELKWPAIKDLWFTVGDMSRGKALVMLKDRVTSSLSHTRIEGAG